VDGDGARPAAVTDLEKVRRSIEAAPDAGAMLLSFAEDARWESIDLGFDLRGLDAIRGFLTDWYSSYEETETRAENLRDLGDGVIVGESVQSGRLADSPGAVSQRSGIVAVMRDGMVVHVYIYREPEEARAAAEQLVADRRLGA
jgi:ketosteroid isomerase-like protein